MHGDAAAERVLARLCGMSALLMLLVLAASAALRLGHAGCIAAAIPEAAIPVARIVHRIAASLVGMLLVAVVFIAYRHRPMSLLRLKLLAGLIGFTVFLAMLGRISAGSTIPLVTIANVIAGIALYVLIRYMQADSVSGRLPVHVGRGMLAIASAARALAGIQIWIGAWLAGIAAGFGCQPISGNGDIPHWPGLASLNPMLPSSGLESMNAVAWLRVLHELSAAAVLVFVLLLAWRLTRPANGLSVQARRLFVVVAAQAGLGIAMAFLDAPAWIGVVHNVLAAILLGELARLGGALRLG